MNEFEVFVGELCVGCNSCLSVEDWVQVVLDLIVEQGVGVVVVELLVCWLGVIKGSFYWYFLLCDVLLQVVLECWELFEQEQVFGSLVDVIDLCVCLCQLFQVVVYEVQLYIIYSELFKVLDYLMVCLVIDCVLYWCLEYLVVLFWQVGFSCIDVQYCVWLVYVVYVGFLQLLLQLQQFKQVCEDFEVYVEYVIEMLILG